MCTTAVPLRPITRPAPLCLAVHGDSGFRIFCLLVNPVPEIADAVLGLCLEIRFVSFRHIGG